MVRIGRVNLGYRDLHGFFMGCPFSRRVADFDELGRGEGAANAEFRINNGEGIRFRCATPWQNRQQVYEKELTLLSNYSIFAETDVLTELETEEVR